MSMEFPQASPEQQAEKRRILERREERYDSAFCDPLTGLPNRAGFTDRIKKELRSSKQDRRQGDQLPQARWVIVGDVDKFKSINDTNGHDVGDKVLQAVARTLQENIRSTDIIARWGGEEFVLVLIDAVDAPINERVEHLREVVEKLKVPANGTDTVPVTISFGVSPVRDEEDVIDAIKRADGVLYKAKESGRNRVEMAEA